MIISGAIKKENLFGCLFYLANLKIKSKRLLVMIVSLVGGALPVEGRVTISAGILNTMTPENSKSRGKFGVIDYLSSHHYYLWSPLEKTIILPMAALGIAYSQMLVYTLPLLIISALYIIGYIFLKFNESDIEIMSLSNTYNVWDYMKTVPFLGGIILAILGMPTEYVFASLALFYLWVTNSLDIKTANSFINWKLVGTLVVVLSLGYITGTYNDEILLFLKGANIDIYSTIGLMTISALVFVSSWLLGSSGKFAGIVSLLVLIYGAQWFVWFFVIDFIAYNLSPTHKCVSIGGLYFGTKLRDYLNAIGIWQILLLIYAGVYTFVLF